jgi:O-methyltransferase involved in polyketide biosynthesis
MNNQQSSKSAESMALLRAIEAQKPEAKRICYDPSARTLIPGGISNSPCKIFGGNRSVGG